MLEFVDLEAARAARGVRMVTPGNVASPWSEAAKGLFRVAGIPVLVNRFDRTDDAQQAWTHARNVPVVFHGDDPPRTVWSQILALAVRLGPPGALVPIELDRRTAMIGMLHEIAGEDGMGWNARLTMIHAGLESEGTRGFSLPIAKFLAAKYGYTAGRMDVARAQVITTLVALGAQLGERTYFGDDQPSALDVYVATFLTPLCELAEADCPALGAPARVGFAAARDEFAAHVPGVLHAHRARMFARHLAWPITL
ncbi:MAG: hypothetical protein WKG01_13890 [Kofleriaceae bacterium]